MNTNKFRMYIFELLMLFLFFVLITFITVPFIRAIESWLILFIIYLVTHFFIKKKYHEDCVR